MAEQGTARRRCIYHGCRAWPLRGGLLCVAHQRMVERENRDAAAALGPLRDQALLDDLAIIDAELDRMLAARDEFKAWALSLRERDEAEEEQGRRQAMRIRPGDYIRAWDRVSARIVQLVRARRELLGRPAAEGDGLVAAVLEEIMGEEGRDDDA